MVKEQAEEIELLVTDVVMPHLGGVELADSLATTRPETRVLFMTGHTETAIRNRDHLKPGVQLLQKPFSANALLRKIREVLDAE